VIMGDFVSLNGRLIESHRANLGINDRGFLLGDGLFETIRIKDHKALALDAHLSRLHAGADLLGFPQFGLNIKDQIDALIQVNSVAQGCVRLTVSRGRGQRGVLPDEAPNLTILITALSMAPSMTPMRLHVTHVTRRNQFSPLSRMKTLNYLDNVLVRQDAARCGADDGIVLNVTGQVAETSVGNLLFRLGGNWVTPPVDDGALPGTARGALIAAGLLVERSLQDTELVNVDSAVMVNALSLRVVTHIDGQALSAPTDAEYKAFAACLDL